MLSRITTVLLLTLGLTACQDEIPRAVGQLLSDRVELVVESSEALTAIAVQEGEVVAAGTLLLSQDATRLDLKIQEAAAMIGRLEALLLEQLNGPREEVLAVARAELNRVEVDKRFYSRELQRLTDLRVRNLTSVESVDMARRQIDVAEIGRQIAAARLQELVAGTRPEQLEQVGQQLLQAKTQLASLELDRQRLAVVAPVAGVVDALPFEIGERPRIGDVVAVLLTGTQPLARVYVPEILRAGIRPGDVVQLSVDGVGSLLTGTVLRIASEAAFTPYFALTESDRGRLSYLAEISLAEMPDRLPDGLPVEVNFELSAGSVGVR